MSDWLPSLLESAGELVFPKLFQSLPHTVFDDLFRDLGEDAVAKRICEDLDDDGLLDSKLCVSLRVLLFFMHSKALLSRFFAAGICKSAVAALQRQRLSGSADYLAILWLRVDLVLTHALIRRTRSPGTSLSAAETLQSLCSSSVVEFIAYGIVHILMKDENCTVSLKNSVDLLEELVANLRVSIYNKDAASRVNSQQFVRFRQELRRYWVPSLHALDGMASADDPISAVSNLRKAWRTLGTVAGLNEIREREHFDKHGSFIMPSHCAWERCTYNVKKPSARLRLCKGCGDVAYCSRQCQMSHWKEGGHKSVCRRVKNQ